MRVLISLIVLVCVCQSFGQTKKAERLVTKAEQAIQERQYQEADDLLCEAIAADSTYARAYDRLFFLYRRFRKLEELYALRYAYLRHVPESRIPSAIRTALAQSELSKGNYDQMEKLLQANAGKPGLDEAYALLQQTLAFSRKELARPKKELEAEWLPETVNRFAYQYLPVLTVDGQTLFYTARSSVRSDENLVVSRLEDGNWTQSESLSSVVNSRANEGACTVSADGRELIFTACEGRQGFGNCDLFYTERKGELWSRPINLGRSINSRYWDSQPSLSPDGKTLYFVSERPGGSGGKDIWISRKEKGAWQTAVNAGPVVNSKGEEATPFIHADNKTLFFTSNGYPGMGGYDLFRSIREGDDFGTPVNLGYPLNTYKDEVSLFITADGQRAYYAQETVELDRHLDSRLATFLLDSPLVSSSVRYITGIVSDEDTGLPLGATIELVDLDDRKNLYATSSDPVTGRYFVVLTAGESFDAFVSSEGYLFKDLTFATALRSDTLDISLSPLVSGKRVVLEHVYFQTGSYQLDQKSIEELERIFALLTTHKDLRVEISGHTDNTGGDELNDRLSLQRARTVFNYLLQKGIPAVRMRAIGLGDRQPRAQNSSEAGRRMNRRIEFRIL